MSSFEQKQSSGVGLNNKDNDSQTHHHSHSHNNEHEHSSQCNHENEEQLMNPWDNPYCVFNEPLLTDPTTNELETKENQNQRLELQHFHDIITAYNYYSSFIFEKFQRKHYDWLMLPIKYKKMTANIPLKFEKIKKAVIQNQSIITMIVENSSLPFIMHNMQPSFVLMDQFKIPSSMNMSKVRSTLRQLCRDWSSIGASERQLCYQPILDKLSELYPVNKCPNNDRSCIEILNPGCGLARLPWEIARLGFKCQGNEFSYFMLLASHFVLNTCSQGTELFQVFPYCDELTNVWSFENDQMISAKIPDLCPALLCHEQKRSDLMSMSAGDFGEIYSKEVHKSKWDCIVSCFFIDTAHNILQYLDIFSHCLKMNGYILNIGPLLYHFDDMTDPSIELTYNEIVNLLPQFGFKIIYENKNMKCPYTQNPNSMIKMRYDCAFWIAQKIQEIHDDTMKNDQDNTI